MHCPSNNKGYANFSQTSSLGEDQHQPHGGEGFENTQTMSVVQDVEGEVQTEEKIKDYGMRLFTGSESLLRELKLSTPKEERK